MKKFKITYQERREDGILWNCEKIVEIICITDVENKENVKIEIIEHEEFCLG